MRHIPGDPEFGKAEAAEYIGELTERVKQKAEELYSLSTNVDAVVGVIKALGLDEEYLETELADTMAASGDMLDTATRIFGGIMGLAGVAMDTVDEGSAPPVEDDTPPPPTDPTEQDKETRLLPPELRGLPSEDNVRHSMGERVFPIGRVELGLRPELVDREATFVAVTENGQGLWVFKGDEGSRGKSTTDLPTTVVRGINMYNRLSFVGAGEFQKSDVSHVFGPIGGFTDMSIIQKTNTVLAEELGLPPLFEHNGKSRGGSRYKATDKVLFISEKELSDATDDSAS